MLMSLSVCNWQRGVLCSDQNIAVAPRCIAFMSVFLFTPRKLGKYVQSLIDDKGKDCMYKFLRCFPVVGRFSFRCYPTRSGFVPKYRAEWGVEDVRNTGKRSLWRYETFMH